MIQCPESVRGERDDLIIWIVTKTHVKDVKVSAGGAENQQAASIEFSFVRLATIPPEVN